MSYAPISTHFAGFLDGTRYVPPNRAITVPWRRSNFPRRALRCGSAKDPTAHDRALLNRSTEADPYAARILGRHREPESHGTDRSATGNQEGQGLDLSVILAIEGVVRFTVLQAQPGIQRLSAQREDVLELPQVATTHRPIRTGA